MLAVNLFFSERCYSVRIGRGVVNYAFVDIGSWSGFAFECLRRQGRVVQHTADRWSAGTCADSGTEPDARSCADTDPFGFDRLLCIYGRAAD